MITITCIPRQSVDGNFTVRYVMDSSVHIAILGARLVPHDRRPLRTLLIRRTIGSTYDVERFLTERKLEDDERHRVIDTVDLEGQAKPLLHIALTGKQNDQSNPVPWYH